MSVRKSSDNNYVQVGPIDTTAVHTGTVWFNNIPYYPSDTDTYTVDDTGSWVWVSPTKYWRRVSPHINEGWECPKCGLVWAPWISHCPACQAK